MPLEAERITRKRRIDPRLTRAGWSVVPFRLAAVSAWAGGGAYEPAAVSTFLQVADYYLVAHAHAHAFTVVTHEVAAQTVKKIKIPNACIGLGVTVMSPYEMLRIEKARFVLGGTVVGGAPASGGGNSRAPRQEGLWSDP
jgi:exosortase/archaeosortase